MKPETTYAAIIGRVLAQNRKKRGLDQEAAAKAAGLNRSSWSRLENGEAVPSAVQLAKIAQAFKIGAAEIFTEADKARKELEAHGVRVHLDKVSVKKSKAKTGIGLALLGAAALGAMIAKAVADKPSPPAKKEK